MIGYKASGSRSGRLWQLLVLLIWSSLSPVAWGQPDWTWTARIATPWDYPQGTFATWEEAVDRAIADGANAVLDWSRLSDDWRCLFDPALSQDLAELKRRAGYVHQRHPEVHYLVYVAPLEYVTPNVDLNRDGRVDPGREKLSLAVQHPDWLQVGIDGRKAVFYGTYPGMPFWVCETCEDVWLTPANPEYRALALEQARRIAATGVDGVWLDVPFLRYEYGEGWRDQWPTLDRWAREVFAAETGYRVPWPAGGHWPDWDDPAWRAFVRWRYTLTARFLEDYRTALKSVAPGIVLIIETSVGPDVTMTQLGSSTLDLLRVSDLTAHELDGPWQSGEASHYTWLRLLAELLFWRHTEVGRPIWSLSYVKAGEKDTPAMARLHAAMILAAGLNYYTSGNETMSGMPDAEFRRRFFNWLGRWDSLYYGPGWRPYANVALVYSQRTLDYLDRGSWESDLSYHDAFLGMAMMLLESHIPFQVLTERELNRLAQFDLAVMPIFAAMSAEQARAIRDYVARGGTIVATGPISLYTEEGIRLPDYRLADVLGVKAGEAEPGSVYVHRYGSGKAIFLASLEREEVLTPELAYYWSAEPWPGGTPHTQDAEVARRTLLDLIGRAGVRPLIETDAPKGVILLPFMGNGKLVLQALNLHGVRRHDPSPTPVVVDVSLELPPGARVRRARRLVFLGGDSALKLTFEDGRAVFSFPLAIHTAAELSLECGQSPCGTPDGR